MICNSPARSIPESIVDFRINETLQTIAVRKLPLPFSSSSSHVIPINRDLVGTVFNSAYAVRLETAPTKGKSVYLFEGCA